MLESEPQILAPSPASPNAGFGAPSASPNALAVPVTPRAFADGGNDDKRRSAKQQLRRNRRKQNAKAPRRQLLPPESDDRRYVFVERPACPTCGVKDGLRFDHTRQHDDGTVSRHATCPRGHRFILVAE